MKKTLMLLLLATTFGCSERDKVVLDDYRDLIDANKARIELLETQNELQSMQIDSLDVRVTALEARMDQAESDIISNTDLTISLTDGLSADIDLLRQQALQKLAELRRADRNTRIALLLGLASLHNKINREVRDLEAADQNLQNQINNLNSQVASLTQRFNSFRALTNIKLFFLGLSLASLANEVDQRLDAVEADVAQNREDIEKLKKRTRRLRNRMNDAESDIAALESSLASLQQQVVSVVEPCPGADEVLLQTQDGLVALFLTRQTEELGITVDTTIPAIELPATQDKYCTDRRSSGGGNQQCREYAIDTTPAQSIPAQTVSAGDTVSFDNIDEIYLSVLGQGTYQTTDSPACIFSIDSNGELVTGGQ